MIPNLSRSSRASMLHAHLDITLKMFVRSFEGRTIEGVLGYIGYQGAARLRARVAKLARDKLDDVRASQTGRRSDRSRP